VIKSLQTDLHCLIATILKVEIPNKQNVVNA
jgi:hypothetical protein